jgi:hypothetical protein
MAENEYKLASFLNEKSLTVLNEVARNGGVKYVKKRIRKPIEEKIDYRKLMKAPNRSEI